ncbi:MAG: glycosyltransferase [Candidatus Aenigmarchaeota archaeon]|nr:glycosyltransferase [Candidatus Aenigmarchaeota archaeon]
MIFLTVGTHTQSFDRLIEEMDRLVGDREIREKVVGQIGNSAYEPRNFEWFRFTDFGRLNKLYDSADVLVTHGGAGSILNGLSRGKPVVAMPRLARYYEHVNDHQVELVTFLEKKRKIIAVYDARDLVAAISKAKRRSKLRTENKVCDEIEKFLAGL